MKLSSKVSLLFLSTLLSVSCGGNNNPGGPNTPTLDHISLSGTYQIEFYQGDEFNCDGLIVTAYYTNNEYEVVEDYSVGVPNMSILGNQAVVVSCEKCSETYYITVHEKGSAIPTLKSLSLTGGQREFIVGDEFTYEGLVITGTYSDGSTKYLLPTNVVAPDMSTTGNKDVYVYVGEVYNSYKITVKEREEIDPEYKGYMYLNTYHMELLSTNTKGDYIYPGVIGKDNEDVDYTGYPFEYKGYDTSLIEVNEHGKVTPKSSSLTGTTVVTVEYTVNKDIKASCTVSIVNKLTVKRWFRVDDFDSIKEGDILVLAAPEHGVTASLKTQKSRLETVKSTFNYDKTVITTLGKDTAEFYVAEEMKDGERFFTLETQTYEYLKSTHVGKVSFDSSTKTNRYWDILFNLDVETEEPHPEDGAIILNKVASLGYLMFNVLSGYFTTYVENSLRPGIMELPFIYRLEESI